MIETAFTYLTVLIFIASLLVYLEHKTHTKLFEYLPPIVILYFSVMSLSTLGLWQSTDAIKESYNAFKSNLLPAMIFLMLLQADIRKILKLGRKILLTFFLASLSISLGFIIMFALMHHFFDPEAWKAFGALSGSWMGGMGNMVAIQNALVLPDSQMGYVLLIDSIDYAVWVMILLALVPFAPKFNRWSRSDASILDSLTTKLDQSNDNKPIDFVSLFMMLGLSLMISVLTQQLAMLLPMSNFLTPATWVVILATLAGIFFGMTPLSRNASASPIANIMLYLIVALIASRADFKELAEAPIYIVSGFMIILIHALFMVLFSKLFRLDLFSIGVASLANIGGVASAPILAGAYHRALIPIGVLMAMMGYIIGTFVGLGVAHILRIIAS
ncbi:MAG: DUF819 family protein [Campylobacterales bacterium]|nr:DUF819 family protein [Campylobacterales bacterium]